MPDKPNNPFKFWEELKRRKVVRVITVYGAAAFVIIELANNITEPLNLPNWVPTLVIILLFIGFFFTIVMSWLFDITSEGIKKTKPTSQNRKTTEQVTSRGWKISTYISGLVIICFVVAFIIGNIRQSSDISMLERSIAVLPFDNMSDSEDYSYMGDAITDELILELQKIKEFDRVLSRSSTMQFKDNRPTIPEIAEKLGVNYLIEGSILRHENMVSIRVKVFRAQNEDRIWGDKFDGRWGDILSIQDNIAFRVANELKIALSHEEIESIEKIPTKNAEAYELYMKGRFNWNLRTKEKMANSIDYFKQAIELDNEYAHAYSGLADAYYISADWNFMNPDSANKKARFFALKSISIDNKIAEPYATLALLARSVDYDNDMAEFCFKKALALNPSYASANQWYALYLTQEGEFDEALCYMEKALKYDPESAVINYAYGIVYFYAEEYDKAISQFKNTLKINPSFPATDYMLICYLQIGQYFELIKLFSEDERIVNRYPIEIDFSKMANEILNIEGIYGLIRYIIELELKTTNPRRDMLPVFYAFVGDDERALDILKSNIQEKIPEFLFLNVNPVYKNLRSDPRFIELLKKVNLE